MSLVSCDGERDRKELENDAIAAFQLPGTFQIVDQFEDGNGGGGPIAVYAYEGDGPVPTSDIAPPDGYKQIDTPRSHWPSFVPALDARIEFRSAFSVVGPASNGEGECMVTIAVSKGDGPGFVALSPACSVDGPISTT